MNQRLVGAAAATFLGPYGTFADTARRSVPELTEAAWVPGDSIPAVFDAIRRGDADVGLVPIENSVEGSVSVTLDELNSESGLTILGEVAIPVRFTLAAATAIPLAEIRAVGTHPHAYAQCRGWLSEHLPQAANVATLSTAAPAEQLAAGTARGFDAAVVSATAAEHYGLVPLVTDIGDNSEAWTRFILVGRSGPPPAPTGNDKTSLVLFIRANRAGALLEILTELAVRGVNLTRLESRPTRRALGDYCFSVDLEGHVAEERIADALMGLQRQCAGVRFLGSYPAAGSAPVRPAEGVRDEDYEAARQWFQAEVLHRDSNAG